MSMMEVDKWMTVIIGTAARKGATQEELEILCEAAKIIPKYKPRKDDDVFSPVNAKTDEEIFKTIVNSKERRIELV